MADYREAFVEICVAKLRNAIAIADAGREGEVRFFGEVEASPRACAWSFIGSPGRFDCVLCYEAGPTGYGIASSDRSGTDAIGVKTNRRDAVALARLLRGGELTGGWVSDESHEALRDLVRARAAAVETLRAHRQQVSAFMFKHGRLYPRNTSGMMRYLR